MNMKKMFYFDNRNHEKSSCDAPVIAVTQGERGYRPIYTPLDAAHLNGPDVTPQELEAAYTGSLFGWDVPGADPNYWNEATFTGEHSK